MAAWEASYLEQAIERGLLPPQNSQVMAYCVVGMIERVAYHQLAQDVANDLDTLADVVARLELLGILSQAMPDVELALTGKEVSP